MSTQHTPWKLWNGYGPLHNGKYAVSRIGPDTAGMFDGLVGSEGHDIVGTKEHLEYVVLAVNNHDALLEALKAIQLEVKSSNPTYMGVWYIAEDAIAAAEARTP